MKLDRDPPSLNWNRFGRSRNSGAFSTTSEQKERGESVLVFTNTGSYNVTIKKKTHGRKSTGYV